MKTVVNRIGVWLGVVLAGAAIAALSHALVGVLFRDTGALAMEREIPTRSGVMDVGCSLASRLKVGQQVELRCSVRPRTNAESPQLKYPLGMFISLGGSPDFDIPSGFVSFQLTSSEAQSVMFQIRPRHSGASTLFVSTNVNGDQSQFVWPVDVAPGFYEVAALVATAVAALGGLLLVALDFRKVLRSRAQLEALTEKKISEAESKAERAPEKAKFAWDLARVKLEAYFDRNLSQVNQVFYLSATVMLVGFGFVLFGVIVSISQPKLTPSAVIAGISGIISQFIGATFLVIYRSTMAQANEFMAVLERINTVGMAMQVLDSIPEGQLELKNSTRTEIINLLLSANITKEKMGKSGQTGRF